jgi:hypothetical protein
MATHGEIRRPPAGRSNGRLRGVSRGRRQGFELRSVGNSRPAWAVPMRRVDPAEPRGASAGRPTRACIRRLLGLSRSGAKQKPGTTCAGRRYPRRAWSVIRGRPGSLAPCSRGCCVWALILRELRFPATVAAAASVEQAVDHGLRRRAELPLRRLTDRLIGRTYLSEACRAP